MIAQLCKYTKSHLIIHFTRVNFLICELDINLKIKLLEIK